MISLMWNIKQKQTNKTKTNSGIQTMNLWSLDEKGGGGRAKWVKGVKFMVRNGN